MTAHNAQLMLSNANDFFEMLDYEFQRASRYKHDVTLLFIKLSNLAEIGTKYGQLTAVRILSKIERVIRDNIRSSDREFIYGSDEIMIILPQTPKDSANYIIPKLKRLMEHCSLTNGKESQFTITPNFGVSSYQHDALTREGVIKLAENIS